MAKQPTQNTVKIPADIMQKFRVAVTDRYGTVYGHIQDEVCAALVAHGKVLKLMGPLQTLQTSGPSADVIPPADTEGLL